MKKQNTIKINSIPQAKTLDVLMKGTAVLELKTNEKKGFTPKKTADDLHTNIKVKYLVVSSICI